MGALEKGRDIPDWSRQFNSRVQDAILRLRNGESPESIRAEHGAVVVQTAREEIRRKPGKLDQS